MTVQIIHAAEGYEVSSPDYRHLFADRDKALLVAQIVALTAAAGTGRKVAVQVPCGWPALDECAPSEDQELHSN